MDIYGILKKEHKKVKGLFKAVQNEQEPSVEFLMDKFHEIKSEMDVHMAGEEKFFYPPLESNAESMADALEAVEEHRVAREIMNTIESDEMKDVPHMSAKLKVLSDVIDHHIKEEEKELFLKAHKVLKHDQVQDITKNYEEEKQKAMATVSAGV